MTKIKILLADDHELFIEGLTGLISKVENFELAGRAHDGAQAVEQAELLKPDIILMDMTMPNMNGINAARQILSKLSDTKIIVLSMHGDREFIVESLKAGVKGYILKECTSEELNQAIISVYNGFYYIAASIMPIIIEDYLRLLKNSGNNKSSPMSERELEILKLFVNGQSSKQIAAALSISKNTVDTHRRRILDKAGCNNLAELTHYAIRNGYIDPM